MSSKNRIIFIIGILAQLQGSSQIDKDENRPYEFSFTIDGEQHRYEKKDVQGIIQGEFGFITGDGIYHVTVYATDENGSFKILSMKNVRVSGPLDGSNVDIKNVQDKLILKYTDKPISRPEVKYTTSKPLGIYETKYSTSKPAGIYETKYSTSKPLGIYETKYTSKSSYKPETATFKPQIFNSPSVNRPASQIYTTTPRTSIFKITTVSTIRPGCGGCGIIARTTPKAKPLQNLIPFSNNKPPVESSYPRPLSLPVTPPKPNYSNNHIYNNNDKPSAQNTAYFKPETYETTTKPSLHYNYNFENHAKPEAAKPPIHSGNNYENNNYKQETYDTTAKPSLLGNNNFGNNFKPQTFGTTAKPSQFNSNNYYDKSSIATSYNPTSKPEPFTSNNNFGNNFKPQTFETTVKPSQFNSNNYYDKSSIATSYNPTSKPEPFTSNNNFGNNFKPQTFETTVKPSQSNSNNYYDKSSIATSYNPTSKPESFTNNNNFGNNFKPQTFETTRKPSQFNSNNYYDKSSKATSYNPPSTPEPFTSKRFETSTKRIPSNYNAVQFNPITPSKNNLQENKNVIYPSPQKPIHSVSSEVKTENGNIYVPGIKPIPIKDKYPNMKEGLPNGITQSDIVGLLYKFNYTVGFHGHYEKGWNNGTKIGGYFVNGRDGYSRIVTYIADENGYRPKFRLVHLGYDSTDTPKADSEKKFGLKNFEFVWYPVN